MSWRKSLPIVAVVLAVAGAALVGAAMFVADQHEEIAHAYDELRALKNAKDARQNKRPDEQGDGMVLWGHWNGLAFAAIDSPSMAAPGFGHLDKGAAIVAIDPQKGQRARRAGLQIGDVVVAVDQKPINGLADLYARSYQLPPGTPVMFDVQRQGQLVTLVLEPQMLQVAGPAFGGPQLYCPRDGVLVPAAQRGAGATCPICKGPLHVYDPNVVVQR